MSTPVYSQNPGYLPPYPAAGQPVAGPYYQTVTNGQSPYVRSPDAVIQERSQVSAAPPSALGSWFDYSNSSYIKGLVVGTSVTLLVTNPTVQTAVAKSAVAAWTAVVGGVEEIKERIRDAKAEKSQA